jgi:hypothetical protein
MALRAFANGSMVGLPEALRYPYTQQRPSGMLRDEVNPFPSEYRRAGRLERLRRWLQFVGKDEIALEASRRFSELMDRLVQWEISASDYLEWDCHDEEHEHQRPFSVALLDRYYDTRVMAIDLADYFDQLAAMLRSDRRGYVSVPDTGRTISVDLERHVVKIGTKAYGVTPRQAEIVNQLVQAQGGWLTGKQLQQFTDSSERVDQIIKRLDPAVQAIIESKRAHGYRLRP